MNDSTRVIGRPPRARPPAARTAAAIIATAGLTLLAAACGGSPSSAGSGGSPSLGGSASSPSVFAFARCVRHHGVPNYPDPGSNGPMPNGSVQQFAQQLGVSFPRLRAALDACVNLNPKANGQGSQPLTAQEQRDYLRAARCMRLHGITNLPDPTFPGGHVNFTIPSSMDTTSPRFTQALRTCQKLIPAGFPYSGSGG